MQSSQLIDLLKLLSPEEIKNFRSWILSPFFNTNPSLVKLFDYVRKYNPAFDSKNLAKEKIYKHLYGQRKFNDQTMRVLISDLSKQINCYLSYEFLAGNPLFEREFLIRQLHRRDSIKLMEKQLKDFETAILTQEKFDLFYTYHKMNFQILTFEFHQLSNQKEFENTFKKMNIDKLENAVREFYYQTLLSNYLSYYGSNDSYKLSKNIDYVGEFLDHIQLEIKSENPTLQTLYASSRLVIFKNDAEFYNLKLLLIQLENRLNQMELSQGYTSISNYCIQQIKKGRLEFSRIKFELDKIIIQKQIKTEGEMHSSVYFTTVARNAIWLKEFDWAEKYIDHLDFFIKPKFYEPNVSLLKAELLLYKSKYAESLALLNTIKYDSAGTQAAIKSLSIMIFFQQDDFERFENLCANLKYFLRKDEDMTDNRKLSFVFFISCLNKLFKCKLKPNLNLIKGIELEINSAESVLRKGWLLERVKEIESKILRRM